MTTLTTLCVFGVLALATHVVIFSGMGYLLSESHKSAPPLAGTFTTRFLILVPAHNEAEHLRPTLRSLRKLDYPSHSFDLTVIADNCTDNTASVARDEGCDVWVRSDQSKRGKGHALGWALRSSPVACYDAVVILDADTRSSPNLLQVFARELRSESVPVQARVDFEFPLDSPAWLALTSSATQRAEELYVSAPRSFLRLYQGLEGTGFCLPTSILQLVPWSAYSICEDLEYSFQLASKGVAPRFVQDAFVTSSMTGRLKYASQQRERWARGTYSLIAKLIPLQILHTLVNRDWRSLESCFYLATRSRLPLAFLTALSGLGIFLCGPHVARSVWLSFAIVLALEATYVFAIVSALRPQYGRKQLFLGFFRYSIWIFRQHLGALLSLRNTRWIRTERG
jgi:cellulose synthase/poly-beta-1,6-N-acetylglucosamine synthase-like glycosyltransferase